MSTELKKYYESLSPTKKSERRKFIETVMAETGKAEITVFNYIAGRIEPDLSGKKIIAMIAGKKVEELFPDQK